MHSFSLQSRITTRRLSGPMRAITTFAALGAGLLVFGCGGGDDSSGASAGVSRDAIVGTWSGTLSQTKAAGRAVAQFGLTLQFLKGSSANAVAGTLFETTKVSISGVQKDIVSKIGGFTGTVTNGTVDLTGTLHYDANDKADPNSTQTLHAVLTAPATRATSSLTGSYTQGSHSGNVTITNQTSASTPNLNATGTWGPTDPSGAGALGGLTLVGQHAPAPFTLDITQAANNIDTSVTFNSPALSTVPYSAIVGGTVGNSVTIQGNLPANAPTVAGFSLANVPYVFSATVDPTGKIMTGTLTVPQTLGGGIQIQIPVATFTLYRQAAQTAPGTIIVPIQ